MTWQSPVTKAAPARERFSPPLVVLGIFCSFLAVLALLFPGKKLLEVLDESDDAATIRYREAVLRKNPADTDLRMSVAKSLQRTGKSLRALELLSTLPETVTAPVKESAIDLRYASLRDLLAKAAPGSSEWREFQSEFRAAADTMAKLHPQSWQLRSIAADALKAGDEETYRRYLEKVEALEPKPVPPSPFDESMARGDYRTAAGILFDSMNSAGTLADRRALFMKGVRTLQSGNLPQEALREGERHLGTLSNDRSTLIFLTRAALAANQPARAQTIIKRALGINGISQEAGVR